MKKEKKDYNLEVIDNKENKLSKIPVYMEIFKLSDEEEKLIKKQALEELSYLKDKRKNDGWDNKWDILDAYYFLEDIMLDSYCDIFKLHMPTARIKSDAISWAINQALFENEKKFSSTPRPSFSQTSNADEICAKQEEWLNYKWENLQNLESQYGLIINSAVWKGVGIGKWIHEIDYEDRSRIESYKPKIEKYVDPATGEVTSKDENNCAERFKQSHFQRMKDEGDEKLFFKWYSDLLQGKELTFNVEYLEMIYNDPCLTYVDLKNFYVNPLCEKNKGLSKFTTYERLFFTYEQLKDKEQEGEFYNVDKLTCDKDGNTREGYRTEEYKIIMACGYFYFDEARNDKRKVIIWFDEEREIVVGSISYPFVAIPSMYVAHYIEEKRSGFYEDGIGINEVDMNIGQDVLLNFTLDAFMRENCDIPIVQEDSPMIMQFINKRYKHGIPIELPQGEKIDFVSNYRRNSFDVERAMMLIEQLGRQIDDSTGVSSLKTGGESQLDPSAPAKKTMLLLEQSGANIKKYIKKLLNSFNISAKTLIKMYAQIDNEYGYKYRPMITNVVGEPSPFNDISREDLIADTKIVCQAYNFDFERLNYTRSLIALKQILDTEPLFRQNPKAVHEMLKIIIKTWHPLIANKINLLLPNESEFKKMMTEKAVEGVAQYINMSNEQSKLTGLPPQYDQKQLIQVVNQMVDSLVNVQEKQKGE